MKDRFEYVGQQALLIFQTTHIDRAGETSSTRLVKAEIAEVTDEGIAWLVSEDDVHLQFPVDRLVAGEKECQFLGGQEMIRDFHAAVDPVKIRWFNKSEISETIAAVDE